MEIYEKKFSTLCYISRPNGFRNKISLLQTQFWQNQARRQVLKFRGEKYIFKEKDFFYHMFKTNVSEHDKICGHKKDLGVASPECPPCLRAWAEPSPESLPLGTFMFVQRG